MFNFDLKNYSKERDIIHLREPNSFYISFFIILILLTAGLLTISVNLIPLILTILSLILLTYREEWIFNKKSQSITYLRGAVFLYKRSRYNFDDLEEVDYNSLVKGKKDDSKDEKLPFYLKRYYYLKLFFKNGDSFTVLTIPERLKDRTDEVYNIIK